MQGEEVGEIITYSGLRAAVALKIGRHCVHIYNNPYPEDEDSGDNMNQLLMTLNIQISAHSPEPSMHGIWLKI